MRTPTRLLAHLMLVLLCLPCGALKPALAQKGRPAALDIRTPPAALRPVNAATAAAAQDEQVPANAPDQQVKGVPQPAIAPATVTVSDLAQLDAFGRSPQEIRFIPEPKGEEEVPRNRPVPKGATIFRDETGFSEASAAAGEPLVPSPAPSTNFVGVTTTGWIPPDTQGAVGPSHLVVAVNGGLRVQNKSGGVLASVSLAGFFAPIMGGSTDVFDPRVEYDQFSNRWMLVAVADRTSAASAVVVAASQTGDPAGVWNLYRLDADAANASWADFPMLGFNKDWIVVSANMFANPGSGASFYSRFFVMNKANAYAGVSLANTIISAPNNVSGAMAPAVTLSGTLAAVYVLQSWNGNPGNGSGFLRLYSITGAVNSPTLNNTAPGTELMISVPAPWGDFPPGGADFAPQLGSAAKLQTNDSRLGNVVYRDGSLWTAHTVTLPAGGPTRSSVQWWEIDPVGRAVRQRGRVDDPSGANFFAFASIAVNRNKDVLVGYSKFSASHYPTAAYSFRAATDPLNTMRDPATLKAGEGPYNQSFNGMNRWGDYSAAAVDPANDTDMWTIQEYSLSSNNWGAWWGRISGSSSTCTSTPISVGQTVTGTLSAASCRYPAGGEKFANPYTFTGTAGQQIAITMSGAFDTFLYLVGPTGTQLTFDDDGGGGTNSRIPATSGFFSLPSSGTYTIQASAFALGTGGSYTLSLTGPSVSCTYGISPINNTVGAGGGSGSVGVTTQSGCSWTAASNAPWISVTSGGSGSGSGTVNYSVAAYTGTSPRSGTITIAGQTFTVTQNGAGSSTALRLYLLPAPVRLLDTRAGQPACVAPGALLTAGVVRTQAAVGPCTGIPANAQGIAGNLAVVNTLPGSGIGFVTLFPSGVSQPNVANINYMPGQIVNNFFTVGLGPDGSFKIFPSSTIHLVVDVTGYYAP